VGAVRASSTDNEGDKGGGLAALEASLAALDRSDAEAEVSSSLSVEASEGSGEVVEIVVTPLPGSL
jgi:hypothetical protein